MPLPFFQKRRETGLIVKTREPDGMMDESGPDESNDAGLEACAQDMIRACEAGDPKSMAAAFRAAFDILESLPHNEAEHEEPAAETE